MDFAHRPDDAGHEDFLLDDRISAADVGLIAAFPREAFVPGRIVHSESQRTRTPRGT